MDRATLAIKARKHWEQWLPNRVRELKEAGEFQQALQSAARKAQEEIANLMRQRYLEHEPEEVVLPQFILLPPEPPGEDDWEAQEAAELERKYKKMMSDFLAE